MHGVANSPGVNFDGPIKFATSFPQIIGMGATFDMDLVAEMASVISTEARAMNNQQQSGLTYFTPNINIFRDPRWGRGQETPGEDPYLTSQYVENLINGLESFGTYKKIVADCKHFTAYDMERSDGWSRHNFSAVVTQQDLDETFMPPFEACVKTAKVSSIMCAYNSVNGVPNCANFDFLTNVLRNQWGFNGFVVSDCGAIDDIMYHHNYTNTTSQTIQVALRAGCDLECGNFYQDNGLKALADGSITTSDLDLAISRSWGALFKLGYFDPLDVQEYTYLKPEDVCTEYATNLSLRAAQESIVLLQNDDSVLPLNLSNIRTIAMIGPHFNSTTAMLGNYYGNPPFIVSPLVGLTSMLPSGISLLTSQGSEINGSDNSSFQEAIDVALKSDIIIFCLGLDQSIESEGHDRLTITLPQIQEELFKSVKSSLGSKGLNTPIVLVIFSGSSVDLEAYKSQTSSIIWAGYPGQSAGTALADVLLGNYNPSGLLPFTIYPANYVNQVEMIDMRMHATSTTPGRTYRFYTGVPVYPFGHGLSYSTFKYEVSSDDLTFHLSSNGSLILSETQNIPVSVTNVGPSDGHHVVLLYIFSKDNDEEVVTLACFKRIFLKGFTNLFIFH